MICTILFSLKYIHNDIICTVYYEYIFVSSEKWPKAKNSNAKFFTSWYATHFSTYHILISILITGLFGVFFFYSYPDYKSGQYSGISAFVEFKTLT